MVCKKINLPTPKKVEKIAISVLQDGRFSPKSKILAVHALTQLR